MAWYQPSFLFSNDNDEAFSSTTHRNWMEFPWQPNEDDEIESITTVNPVTIPPVTSSTEETKTSNFFNIFTNFLPSSKNEKLKVKPRVKNRRVNYDDYQLWRLSTKTKEESKVLEDYKISDKGMNVHWMKGPSTRGFTDVVVSPEYVESFKDFLDDNDIQFDVKIRDLQHAVEYENPRLTKRDQIELEVMNGHPLTWYRYHHYRDIHSYLDYLKRKYPEFVELIQLGWSFEGRPLTVVKVSYPYDDSNNISRPFRNFFIKPGIFIQSGLEAHEWLSIASATYILNNLIMNINSNDTLGETIRGADWYVMPVLNPDGYEYSMNYDRLWQKTRSKHSQSSDFWSSLFNWFSTPENRTEECFGVDVNRNFEYNWMKRDASNEICSDFYGGPEHSSEPEVKLLSKFLMEKDKNIEMFISLTGYGQKITFPSDHLSQDKFDEIKDVARAGVKMATKTLPNNELKFSVEGKRKVAGTIDQFAMHKAKIKFSYAIETRDDSYDKFFVQGSSIEKKAKEMFDVIYGMISFLKIL
ncbi:CLUMA_CG010354, isoform A [Clunio marinus]|uniref:CLUMA_CG010354, isoform A n=1 Tax=Clunio marinus TaxID=568069 RepID=A0A1J1IBG0_9DIPT|nr:CLUMA_CG010354, isoform A [Clunio marinus]